MDGAPVKQEDVLADLVRETRKLRGLSQIELADAVGMSQRWVSDIERGHTKNPRREHLHALAAALKMDVEELYIAANLARNKAHAQAILERYGDVDPADPREKLIDRIRQLNWTEGVNRSLSWAVEVLEREQGIK
jgi:transcriptional regulator with XRE-family HTH domain